ncbi:Lysophospholipase D gdpd1, partial [Cladochytrium tenue]
MSQRLSFPLALMAHRGGSLERVENTLPAFRHAARDLRVDLLEMDVRLTRDGRVVVCHDADLGRLCGVPGKSVADFAYADLPPLKIPEALRDNPHVVGDPDSVRIPLLEEVFAELPSCPMQIDVKSGPEELIRKTGQLIQKFERQKLTIWGSGQSRAGDCCYRLFGDEIPLFFTMRRGLISFVLSWFGLATWMKYRESVLATPNVCLSRRWFRALNSVGISVIVWGIGRDAGGPGGGINTVKGYERVR